ncbi:MAG TPA: zinc ABC transporter substrate-binding protein [Pseudomonadales bacterium]|nr:zinc ABC transporter substrate-binding protein [Pseudomonadales bacterium]
MKSLFSLLLLLFVSAPLCAEEPVLLVTVKPLAWVVQALAPAGANVQVLIPDGQSPHDYQLRPADVVSIQHSALLVWVGPGLEPWLDQIADRLPANRQLALLPHSFHHHDADGHQHTEDMTDTDPHIWLDPLALREQATSIAQALSQIYPAKANDINQRLAQFQQSMSALDKEISVQFNFVSKTGFVVYHDGYQRIVQRYHLNQRAAVWHHESIPAGARERSELLALLNSDNVQCLFYEPEHGRDAVNSWLGSAAAKVKMVELDPLGENVTDGADAYERFMRDLVGKISGCLQSKAASP